MNLFGMMGIFLSDNLTSGFLDNWTFGLMDFLTIGQLDFGTERL